MGDPSRLVDGLRNTFPIVSHTKMCNTLHMATNLAIDDRLIQQAQKAGGDKTKKAAVTEALEEYIQKRRQAQILDLFGKIEFDPQYDYKKQRRRK